MDFQLPSLPVLLASLLGLIIAVKFLTRSKSVNKRPPGPRPLPLIGNMHQLVGKLPHRALSEMSKQYGPLMFLRLGEVPSIVVSSAAVAEEVLKTNGVAFAQRPFPLASKVLHYDCTDIVFSTYGSYWRQMRKISTMELLSNKRVQSYRSIREEEVGNMVAEIKANKEPTLNFTRKIFSYTYGVTGRAAFGKKSADQEEFIRLVEEFSALANFNVADMYPSVRILQAISKIRLKQMQVKVEKILNDIVDRHRAKKTAESEENEDLVDVLLRVQKDATHDLELEITDDNVKSVILDIFAAGSETSSTTVEWTMSELLRNPHMMKRVQTEVREAFADTGKIDETKLPELKYFQALIKETLRYHPSAPLLLPRECREECVVSGYVIPAKTSVFVNGWAIARDPQYFDEPEVYNPDRFLESKLDFRGSDFEYIPFGAGRRSCPGINYALSNIQIALSNLLFHFDWSLPHGMKTHELDMTEAFGLTAKRHNDLIVVATPHQHPTPA